MSSMPKPRPGMIVETCALAVVGTMLAAAAHPRLSLQTLLVLSLTSLLVTSLVAGTRTQGDLGLTIGSCVWSIILPGWLGWIEYGPQNPWTWPGFLGLMVPSALATAWLIRADDDYARNGKEARRRAAEAAARAKLERWGAILENCKLPGVRAVREVERRNGVDVYFRLPDDGSVTKDTLAMAADKLAIPFHLPPAALTFELYGHSGQVVMHVDRADIMREPVPYNDEEDQGQSIHDPIIIGRHGNGKRTVMRLYEIAAWLITGAMGAGKSNFLTVLIARLSRRPDTIVLGIDIGKQGRLFRPWIKPWVEGRCDFPAVSWVATNRKEAYEMLTGVLDVISARSASGMGGSKVKPSPTLPAFAIIVDETADVTASVPADRNEGITQSMLVDVAVELSRKARSEGVKVFWGTQKGTQDFTGSTAIKSMCGGRIHGRVNQEADAFAVTDNPRTARLLAQVAHAGAMVIEMPDLHEALLTKIDRLDSGTEGDLDRIDSIALQHGSYQPEPDQLSKDVLGDKWDQRWTPERCQLVQSILMELHEHGEAVPIHNDRPADEPQRGAVALAEVDVQAEFAALTEGLAAGPPDAKGRILSMLEGKEWGLAFGEIWSTLTSEDIAPARKETVHKWLRELIAHGDIIRSGDKPGARYMLARGGGEVLND